MQPDNFSVPELSRPHAPPARRAEGRSAEAQAEETGEVAAEKAKGKGGVNELHRLFRWGTLVAAAVVLTIVGILILWKIDPSFNPFHGIPD